MTDLEQAIACYRSGINDDTAFERSCMVAVIRNDLITKLQESQNLVYNVNYVNDEEFVSDYVKRNYVGNSSLFNGIVAFFTIGFSPWILMPFSSQLGESYGTAWLLLAAAIFGTVKYISKKIKKANLKSEAESLLPQYRSERDDYFRVKRPEALKAIEIYPKNIEKVTNFLLEISSKYRESIPEKYYPCAGELLYLYKTKRADNLKEAINLWENIQFQMRQAEAVDAISNQVKANMLLAEEARDYAMQAAEDARRAAIDAESASWYSYYNLYR